MCTVPSRAPPRRIPSHANVTAGLTVLSPPYRSYVRLFCRPSSTAAAHFPRLLVLRGALTSPSTLAEQMRQNFISFSYITTFTAILTVMIIDRMLFLGSNKTGKTYLHFGLGWHSTVWCAA